MPWFLALFALSTAADSVRLHPVADTTLFEAAPTNNLGKVSSLAAGTTARSMRSRALLRFDLGSAIPSNAVIVDATLTLSVVRTPAGGGGVDSVFGLHRIVRPWIEGDKAIEANGAPASAGEPTWLANAHPATPWSRPGADAPGDYVLEPSAETLVSGLGACDFDGLLGDVQFWRANPAANFGWILISQDEVTQATARRFAAREATTGLPELRIEFHVPRPPAPRLTAVQWLAGTLHFHFEAQPGVSYTVEHRGGIASGQWLNLTNVGPASVAHLVVVSDAPEFSRRFYRVVAR